MKNRRMKRKMNTDGADLGTLATALAVASSAVVQLLIIAAVPNTRVVPASDLVTLAA
jgi:hypothetical protein